MVDTKLHSGMACCVGFCSVCGRYIWDFSVTHTAWLHVGRSKGLPCHTLIVMAVFYLFSVHYLRVTHLIFRRLFNSSAVMIGIIAVLLLQAMFTYTPIMETFYDTRPVDFVHSLEIFAVGLSIFIILEVEKLIRR